MAKYLHRKCSNCGQWSVFHATDRQPDSCSRCRQAYGRKLELGIDVMDNHPQADPASWGVSPKRAE